MPPPSVAFPSSTYSERGVTSGGRGTRLEGPVDAKPLFCLYFEEFPWTR